MAFGGVVTGTLGLTTPHGVIATPVKIEAYIDLPVAVGGIAARCLQRGNPGRFCSSLRASAVAPKTDYLSDLTNRLLCARIEISKHFLERLPGPQD